MKTYKTVIGKKDFKPKDSSILPIWNWKNHLYSWTVKFHDDCRYKLPDNEQGDWLKGGGITKYFTANNQDSVMWAWRYVSVLDQIEIGLYINDGNKDKKYKSVGFVELEEEFTINLYLHRIQNGEIAAQIKYLYITADLIRTVEGKKVLANAMFPIEDVSYLKDFSLVRKIGLWFGGTLPANKVMHVDVDYKKTKIKN